MRPEERATRDGARRAVLGELLERYRIAAGLPSAGAAARGPGGLGAVLPWAGDGRGAAPTLPVLLDALGPLEPAEVAALALGLVEALEPLHTVGAVRGDLKPLNVMLDGRGVGLRPVDFVSALGADGLLHADFGSALDDPLFLAPEQVLGVAAGPEADVFALGGVLVYAATGAPAFGGGEPEVVLYRVVHAEPALEHVPPSLRGLIKTCLNKDPAQRPTLRTISDRAFGILSDIRVAEALVALRPEEPFPEELLLDVAPPPEPAAVEAMPTETFPAEAYPGESYPSETFPDEAFPDETRVEEPFPASVLAELSTTIEMQYREPFEARMQSPPPRSLPRFRSERASERAVPATPEAAEVGVGAARRRGASSPLSGKVLGAVVVVGVIAAFSVRAFVHSSGSGSARPPATVTTSSAPLPGTFLAGPGCPASPWASTMQSIADGAGLVDAGGGAPQCGGKAIAFKRTGSTAAGPSSYTWTFRLGWSAHCTLAVWTANAAPSSGFAHFLVFVPASRNATGSTTAVEINQGKTKGQWVAVPALTNLALPDGAVQLRLTDAGSFAGDHFHVTASAVRASCVQVP